VDAKTATGRPRKYCRICRPGGPNFRRGASGNPRALDEKRFRALVAAGLSAIEIGKKLGCTRQNVYAHARRRGIAINGPK